MIEEELAALNTEIAQMKGQRAAYEQDITRQKLNRVSSAALLEETSPPHADFAGFPERARMTGISTPCKRSWRNVPNCCRTSKSARRSCATPLPATS